jgi:Winged helix DNA-binding domain
MLWRYATVEAGVRLDSKRRYLQGEPGRTPDSSVAARHFLSSYGPAKPSDFAEWAGLAKRHARRLWNEMAGDLSEVRVGTTKGWLLSAEVAALQRPPVAKGVRLIPPGDPFLQKPNRPLLAPDAGVRQRLFHPVASPGAVLCDGHLVGLWSVKAKGRKTEIRVEQFGHLAPDDLKHEAQRIGELQGRGETAVVLA